MKLRIFAFGLCLALGTIRCGGSSNGSRSTGPGQVDAGGNDGGGTDAGPATDGGTVANECDGLSADPNATSIAITPPAEACGFAGTSDSSGNVALSGSSDNTIQLYELALMATPILVGDYNKDGVVDAADYVVWRRTLGQSVSIGTGADGNFDGQITQADYSVWRSHFGQTAGSGSIAIDSAVPEPAAATLLFIGMFGLGRRRRISARIGNQPKTMPKAGRWRCQKIIAVG